MKDAVLQSQFQPRKWRSGKKASKHELSFKKLWQAIGGPKLEEQVEGIVPGRKFRLDAGHRDSKVGIELHGGIWSGGRHTSGKGFMGDREKMNLMLLNGWVVFELCPQQINSDWLGKIAGFIGRRPEKAN